MTDRQNLRGGSGYLFLHILSTLCLACASIVFAQAESKEMRTLRLRIKEASLTLEQARGVRNKAAAELDEAKQLFEQGLVSKAELGQFEESYHTAELNLEQARIGLERTRLAFINDALYVSLEKASLYRDSDGQKHALLVLKNRSNPRRIIDDKGELAEEEKRGLLSIENLTVRITREGNLIGRPFEYRIPQLGFGAVRKVDFALQREAEAITVEIAYADTVAHLPVYLEKESDEDRVLIEAMQFSQEGELGTRISYELELERFVDDTKTFSLEVLNLPDDYTYEFSELDAEGGRDEQRVSRIRFKKGNTTKTLKLYLNMPRELGKEKLNKKASFQVLALDRFAQQRLGTIKAESQELAIGHDALDSAGLAYETLELIPRGRAEIGIVARNLFHKANVGDLVSFNLSLENTGTVALERIGVDLTVPIDWSANVQPEKDIALAVGSEKQLAVEIVPAADVVAGDYEVKVAAITMHEGREVEATPKTMRIQIEGKSNFMIGAILMIALVGMVIGVAVLTIKVSRR